MSYKSSYTEIYTNRDDSGLVYDKAISNRASLVEQEIEKIILEDICKKHLPSPRGTKYLDFATGTGRIAKFFSDKTGNVTGLDTSKGMLDQAKKKIPNGEFVHGNILEKEELLSGRKFDLITAFRLFLNLEKENRALLLGALKPYLEDDGLLIFNNHVNRWSIMGLVALFFRTVLRQPPKAEKKAGQRGIINTMDKREVEGFVDAAGFEIVKTYNFCFFPLHKNFIILPSRALIPLEVELSRIPGIRNLCKNQIFICRKMKS